MACGPRRGLGTTGQMSWKTGGKVMPIGRQMGSIVRAWGGPQQRAAAVLLDLDLAELVEIIDDVLPFENAVRVRGEEIEQLLPQQHGKEAAEDVTADGRIGLVEDRSRGEQRLGSFEPVLHCQQVPIAQGDLESGELGVGA